MAFSISNRFPQYSRILHHAICEFVWCILFAGMCLLIFLCALYSIAGIYYNLDLSMRPKFIYHNAFFWRVHFHLPALSGVAQDCTKPVADWSCFQGFDKG